jgi:hypothetical protein
MKRISKLRLFWLLPIFASPLLLSATLFADAGDPPARVARLSFIKGAVSLQPAGVSDWSQASLNYPLSSGDRIYTDQESLAELEVGSAAVRASAATDLTVASLDDQFMQLGLGQGTIRLRVYNLPTGDSIEVDTPNGALTILLLGDYRVETFPNGSATLVIVTNGRLEVSGGGAPQWVESGQAAKLTGNGPIQVSFVSPPDPDAFDQWCWDRDSRLISSSSTVYVNPDTPGYEDLDSSGVWDEQTPLGPVWYPAGIPVGWVPYRFGRWVWVVPWGWTWVEREPWGFAPFHYGRWVLIGARWGWVPGPVAVFPCFAPALVVFLGGPQFSPGLAGGVQAWFPLGPDEPFFPWYHSSGAYLRRVNAAGVRDASIITKTTNVSDFNSIHFVNKGAATTVVSTAAFRSGLRIDRQVIRVGPEQLAKAEVIPHPATNPTARALGGGRPVTSPPRITTRPTISATGETLPPVPGGALQPGQPPMAAQNAPTGRGMPGGITAGGAIASGPPRNPPRLITRSPLPPPSVPFSVRQRALEAHPGRPLEPQQEQNLRAGKPAGPMQDREFPPHPVQPAPAAHAEPAPRPAPAPAPQPSAAPRH